MSRKHRIRDQEALYFVTLTVVNWIDLFIRDTYREILLDSFKHCQQQKGLDIYAWCFMTSHLHLIIGTHKEPMENILRDFKRHTSIELHKAITEHPQESRKEWLLWMMQRAGKHNSNNIDWQLWQQHNQPKELSTPEMLMQKLNYIHNNPVEAGFALEPQYYPYSSAQDYSGIKGPVDVLVLDLLSL